MAPNVPDNPKSSGRSCVKARMNSASAAPVFSMWWRAPEGTKNISPAPTAKLSRALWLAEDGDQRLAAHAVGEFVAVGVPVRLAHAPGREQEAADREPLEDGKHRRVDMGHAAAGHLQARLLTGQRDDVGGRFLHGDPRCGLRRQRAVVRPQDSHRGRSFRARYGPAWLRLALAPRRPVPGEGAGGRVWAGTRVDTRCHARASGHPVTRDGAIAAVAVPLTEEERRRGEGAAWL